MTETADVTAPRSGRRLSAFGLGGVQEREDHVEDQIGAGEAVEVRRPGEDGQLRGGDADEVTVDVTAAEPQHTRRPSRSGPAGGANR